MNILITSAGQRVSLIRAFQKELKSINSEAKVLATDMNPAFSPACYISDKFLKVKRVTDDNYISDLLEICKTEEVKMIVPTIDTELLVLAKNKELFKSEGIEIIISDETFISTCRDKRKTAEYFTAHSINVPRLINKDNPTFPLFIKPFDGSLSADTFLIENREQLTDYHLTNDRLLFMEYISKSEYDEFTVDMYFGKDNMVKCIVPRKRIWVRAGEVSKALTCKNNIVSFLKERLNKIQGVVGCLTTQVFLNKENNNVIGIEINPRFGGGYPLSYQAGANFPKWLIEEYFLNKEIQYTDSWEDNLLMLRYDDEIIIHDFSG